MAVVLLPAQLGGSHVGVILAKILPTSAMLILCKHIMYLLPLYSLACCVILFAVYITYCKAKHLYELESYSIVDNSGVSVTSSTISPLENALKMSDSNKNQSMLDDDHSIADNGRTSGLSRRHTITEDAADLPEVVVIERVDGVSVVTSTVPEESLGQSLLPSKHVVSSSIDIENMSTSDIRLKSVDNVAVVPVFVIPYTEMAIIAAVLMIYILNDFGMTQVKKCSASYWWIFAIVYPVLACILVFCIHYVVQKQLKRKVSLLGDVNFSHNKYFRPFLAFIIGLLFNV